MSTAGTLDARDPTGERPGRNFSPLTIMAYNHVPSAKKLVLRTSRTSGEHALHSNLCDVW
jgi:hypothetical protein